MHNFPTQVHANTAEIAMQPMLSLAFVIFAWPARRLTSVGTWDFISPVIISSKILSLISTLTLHFKTF
jgi:hypothetical protein